MKSILFAMGMLSFVIYRSANFDVRMQGTWKGSFRTVDKMIDVKIVFGQNNRMEFYSDEINKASIATGFYHLSNGNKIAITCKWPDSDNRFFTIVGRLNPEKNSLDGDWESDEHSGGSFYLTKDALN